MPEGFDRCISGGGHVRTKVLGGGRYMPICFPKRVGGREGHGIAGEVHTKKASPTARARRHKPSK